MDEVVNVNLIDIIPPDEGVISMYYGRIGSGKTFLATRDVLNDLNSGKIVYCNWRIRWNGYDETKSLYHIVLSLFGLQKLFVVFPKDNLRYIDVDEHFIEEFEKIVDAKVYLDEGHVAFDSYKTIKLGLRERKAVLHTRHFNRSICIISQRPTAVHVSMRANINVFYRCEKVMSWPFLLFRRTEFQDMTNETVDEDDEKVIDRQYYVGYKHLLNAYDSKYMRKETGDVDKSVVAIRDVPYFRRFVLLGRWFEGALRGLTRPPPKPPL